jgi:proteasome lid subunit RPN8/RPN11
MKQDFPYDEIVAYCKTKFPEEACGIVIVFKGRHLFIPCENVASGNKQDYFAIHPVEYAKAEDKGEVVAIVHSHTIHPTVFSETDVAYQKMQGIPWLLVGLKGGAVELEWLDNEKQELPLYGREYVWHVTDCYSFIRDWFAKVKGFILPDFYRREEFWKEGNELYLDNFKSAGFMEVSKKDIQEGDVLLLQLADNITSHGAIYLGKNKIGHHLPGRLSSMDVLGQYYMDRLTKVVRHERMTG